MKSAIEARQPLSVIARLFDLIHEVVAIAHKERYKSISLWEFERSYLSYYHHRPQTNVDALKKKRSSAGVPALTTEWPATPPSLRIPAAGTAAAGSDAGSAPHELLSEVNSPLFFSPALQPRGLLPIPVSVCWLSLALPTH